MKKEAYYFSHDANAMDDPKCMLLIDQMGMEGYGIFWGLIERLRQEKEYKLPVFILPSLAKRWGTSAEKLQVVISKYGLFVMDENFFFSERLRNSMLEKSKKASFSAKIRWNNATALQPHYNGNATAMQNDAIKVKKSKVKESKSIEDKKLSFKNDLSLFLDSYDKAMLNKFYSYWTEPNKSKTKLRFELEKTWDLNLRLKTWASRENDFTKTITQNKLQGTI